MPLPNTPEGLRALPHSGYKGPDGFMTAEEFAVDLGCPKGKGCKAWCEDGHRGDISVILGAEMLKALGKPKDKIDGKHGLSDALMRWNVVSAPKTRRNRRPPKDDTPEAPTIMDRRPEGRAASRARRQARVKAREEKKLLTSGDSEQELTDRIDAVTTALAAVPAAIRRGRGGRRALHL